MTGDFPKSLQKTNETLKFGSASELRRAITHETNANGVLVPSVSYLKTCGLWSQQEH
ncbi:hypothetical protein ISN45_At03g010230 [Arabidopsis thaliana x Arabidopsis arenosa]|jgi:hypothetical protein|uniref:Uncharacterized protein n=2 Tax=Arabidopsis TaxID=3701 RepID=A0A8T2F825_ARASU|nr:hypothetical protein ISN45_At03g010230 [Arabidopsis thaliana x Arabidopsis arenosa]KAG7630740.1 hypothetical protein ISN44_As03g010330 [Arabidopsis suecica]